MHRSMQRVRSPNLPMAGPATDRMQWSGAVHIHGRQVTDMDGCAVRRRTSSADGRTDGRGRTGTHSIMPLLWLLLAGLRLSASSAEASPDWRCSCCSADPTCRNASKCDSVCLHGHCLHNQCACLPTFGKPDGHACSACAPGFSGYPNCIEDPPGARYACQKGRCVDTPGGPYASSTCDNKCGGHHPPAPPPPPGPPSPGPSTPPEPSPHPSLLSPV